MYEFNDTLPPQQKNTPPLLFTKKTVQKSIKVSSTNLYATRVPNIFEKKNF